MELYEEARPLDERPLKIDEWFEEALNATHLTPEDVFNRPDCCNRNPIFLPLYPLQWMFPLRYLTSWYRVLVVIYTGLYLGDAGWPDPNGAIAGSIWILSLYVPLASTVICFYAHSMRAQIEERYSLELLTFHHVIMHILPSEIVFLTTPLPYRPQPFASTGITLGIMIVYALVLFLVYQHTYLSNYFIYNEKDRIAVILLWGLCILFACAVMEFLFAEAPSSSSFTVGSEEGGPRLTLKELFHARSSWSF